jgi:hypothetical protein
MRPEDYRCECGHLAPQHTRDLDERCMVDDCDCEFFVHDEASWYAFAHYMFGRSDKVLAAVSESLRRDAA